MIYHLTDFRFVKSQRKYFVLTACCLTSEPSRPVPWSDSDHRQRSASRDTSVIFVDLTIFVFACVILQFVVFSSCLFVFVVFVFVFVYLVQFCCKTRDSRCCKDIWRNAPITFRDGTADTLSWNKGALLRFWRKGCVEMRWRRW